MSKKARSTLAWVVALMMVFTLLTPINAFAVNQQNTFVPVTGVSISPADFWVQQGTSREVIANVYPSDATNQNVTFTIADREAATIIASSGNTAWLVAGSPGQSSYVIVTTLCGGHTARARFDVTWGVGPPPSPPVNIPVTGISGVPATMSTHVGRVEWLRARTVPENATNPRINFSSDRTSVARVASDGMISAIAPGTAIITATTADGGFYARTEVTVAPSPYIVTGVTLSPSNLNLQIGETRQVTAAMIPSTAVNQAVSFRSSNNNVQVSAVADGVAWITGMREGTADITVTTAVGNHRAVTTVRVGHQLGQPITNWVALRNEINAVPANTPTTIHIAGNITAPSGSTGNAIAIPNNRQITLVSDSRRTLTITNSGQRHFTIGRDASLTLENNITLNGTGTNNGGVQVNAGGTLTLNEGSILENNARTTTGGGVALSGSGSAVGTRATLNMNGGLIRNNAATNGGGVHLGTNSLVNMTSGSIEGNRSTSTGSGAGGGGVMLSTASSTFNMTGGTIRSNRSMTGTRTNAGGGGIRVTNGTFTMSGEARIENNQSTGTAATSGGGGIHQSGGRVHVNGGTITGNHSENQGGGVYVAATTVGAFTMTGGNITNNTARMYGGGIFSTQANHSLTVPTTAYRNLQIGGSATFTGNVSLRGASMPPNNRLAHIVATSSSIFDYVLNNHDINYTGRLGQTESGVTSWAALRAEIAAAPVNLPTRIQIAGNFSAPTGSVGNAIAIPANRNIILVSNENSRRTLTSITGQRHFTIASGATLTLENNITLRGNFNNSGGVQVNAGGTLVMNQGSIIEDSSRTTVGGGVALSGSGSAVGNRATLTMNGGLIRNNSATNGGGVHLGTNSVVNMSSGSIENNRTHSTASGAGGGGVMLNASTAVFNMTGGTIINNRSNTSTRTNAGGGGVRVSNGTFNISGQARIENNQASSALAGMPLTSGGGGIYQSGGRINMTGGAITGNTSDSQGGGVMVATSTVGAFTMTGGSITNNTARVDGGGIFSSQSNNSLTVPATAYRNLQIGGAALFSDNRACGASAPPNNRLAHITATSSSIWDYVLNNYDINYTGRLGQRP